MRFYVVYCGPPSQCPNHSPKTGQRNTQQIFDMSQDYLTRVGTPDHCCQSIKWGNSRSWLMRGEGRECYGAKDALLTQNLGVGCWWNYFFPPCILEIPRSDAGFEISLISAVLLDQILKIICARICLGFQNDFFVERCLLFKRTGCLSMRRRSRSRPGPSPASGIGATVSRGIFCAPSGKKNKSQIIINKPFAPPQS